LSTKVAELLYEIHLEGATDTAVLQGNKAIILLRHYATFLDKFGINIDLTYIIDNHRKAYAAAIGKNAIKKCRLATSEIAR
jgi:hypothetical protein